MTFGILATFPLGVYQGHQADGTAESLPDPARLHAALLCAAAQGPRAKLVGGRLEPSEADVGALAWLEANPPTGIRVPPHQPVSPRTLTAYRHEGTIKTEGKPKRVVDKVISRDHSDGQALAGSIGWVWDEVPPRVQESLTELCADVPCLGETTSPVVLTIADVEPTIRIDPEASAFDIVGHDVRVPAGGRTKVLIDAHRAANGKPPSEAQDRHILSSDQPAPSSVPLSGLRDARYRPLDRVEVQAPWSQVLLVPTKSDIPVHERVRWCVAVHRALISRIGTGASSMVTGAYEPGVERPPNRLAIQYISSDVLAAHGHGHRPAFALLLPRGAGAEDRAELARAMRGWSRVTMSKRSIASVEPESAVEVDGDEFWSDPADGLVRLWRTHPAVVPETRPITIEGRRWTLADAAAVSVGMVWRDELDGAALRGPELYRHLRTAAERHAVRVIELTALQPTDPRSYVHATPTGLVIQPYRAFLSLGTMSSPRTAVAIGQSRHLGGGLLVPVDVPPDLIDVQDRVS